MDIIQLVITTALAVIGLYLAHSLTRQQRLKIAEQRIDVYRKLWSEMFVARPSRVDPPEGRRPLSPTEAAGLHEAMTKWYFEGGHGMLLPHDTREMYLTAKRRLGQYALEGQDGDWDEDGRRIMRDLSLLRSQMKSDLDIYGVFYFDSLDDGDREFIEASGVDPERWGRPRHRWALLVSPRGRT
jgi:alkanesulfonate monooxygenase SsuD/methylene tetrahydromethanopterin reductase-like flavin-dependent oxidoreductase (luciferase family)